MLLEPINKNDFNNIIDIKFLNINDGFYNYSNGLLEISNELLTQQEKEKCFIDFFRLCYENNKDNCYIDFYLKNLQEENISYLLENLEGKNKYIFQKCVENLEKDYIYFKIKDLEYMDLITALNTKSLFFCTIYLKSFPVTIWGNYNFSFPIFFNENSDLEKYISLAKKCGLAINCINYKSKG